MSSRLKVTAGVTTSVVALEHLVGNHPQVARIVIHGTAELGDLLASSFRVSRADDALYSANRLHSRIPPLRPCDRLAPACDISVWSSFRCRAIGAVFEVRWSDGRRRPPDAAIAVRHRGRWFYIADADQTTKSTFLLLGSLFTLQTGDVEEVKPVLTLPVGG